MGLLWLRKLIGLILIAMLAGFVYICVREFRLFFDEFYLLRFLWFLVIIQKILPRIILFIPVFFPLLAANVQLWRLTRCP